MSLRYKALIAAVLLVALVTGVLVLRAGQNYEQAERQRISQQLLADAGNLNDVLKGRVLVVGATLKYAAQSSQLVQLLRDEKIELAANFDTFAREWAEAAGADISLAAIDSFVASERKARVLHATEDLSIVGASVRPGFALDRAALLADAELNSRLQRAFAAFDKFGTAAREAGKPAPAPHESLVLGIGGRVYLCVITALYESLQEFAAIGVGAALVELNSGWLRANFVAAGNGDDRDASMRQIFKVVYVGETATASTWDPPAEAARVLQLAAGEGEQTFEFNLESHEDRFLGLRTNFALAPADLAQRPGFIPFKSLDVELEPLNELRTDISLLGVSLGVLASLLAYLTAYSVIRRIRTLQAATVSVREGKFDTRVDARGRDELSSLGKAFNDMTTGLKALGLYTHETLAKSLLDNPGLITNASSRHEGSIFFSDVKGFTSISESMGAEEVTAQLNEYFTVLGHELRETRGYVDKFIGDGIMAFWGEPFVKEGDYATRACVAALACQRAGETLRHKWRGEGKPEFFQRIGIATGEVVVGNIGTETKKNFTVIGDSVNLASRLEGANKFYGTEALVDARTAELAAGGILFREIDQIRVVGRSEPERIFEPLAPFAGATDEDRRRARVYGQALAAYRARDFAAAAALLEPEGDNPSRWLLQRCRDLMQSPPPQGWLPVTEATSK